MKAGAQVSSYVDPINSQFGRLSSYVQGRTTRLLVVLISLVVDDVEELELVNTLGCGDDAEPVTELLLLEELLGPVAWSQSCTLGLFSLSLE